MMRHKIPTMQSTKFVVVLTARRLRLLRAFQTSFVHMRNIEVVDKDIVSIPDIDAVVSPANSYGFMGGGVDQVYVYTFGRQIEDRVQETIREKYGGCMPIGEAFVISTKHDRIPYLVVAPTMDIPGPIRGTQNVYLAMSAVLRAVLDFNATASHSIKRLGCPGLGTGTGEVPAEEATLQMGKALHEYLGPDESV